MFAERAPARSLLDELFADRAAANTPETQALAARLAAIEVQIHGFDEQHAQSDASHEDLAASNRLAAQMRDAMQAADDLRRVSAQLNPLP